MYVQITVWELKRVVVKKGIDIWYFKGVYEVCEEVTKGQWERLYMKMIYLAERFLNMWLLTYYIGGDIYVMGLTVRLCDFILLRLTSLSLSQGVCECCYNGLVQI